MIRPVVSAYQRLEDVGPLVRPAYNELEVHLFPPYGNPEVHIPSEVGTYVVVGLLADTVADLLCDE